MNSARLHRLLEDCYTGAGWRQPDSVVDDTPELFRIVTPTIPFTWANKIFRFIASEADADERIARALAPYRERGLPMQWVVTPSSRPADLGHRLEQAGLRFFTDVNAMYAEVNRLALELPPDITVEALAHDNVEAYAEAATAGWSQTEAERARMITELHRDLDDGAPMRCFLARHRGEPAGTGMTYPFDGAGYLLGGSVRPELRGHGVYRALVAHRVELLRRAGVPLALVHARDATSAPICAKLGFTTAFVSRIYTADASWAAG